MAYYCNNHTYVQLPRAHRGLRPAASCRRRRRLQRPPRRLPLGLAIHHTPNQPSASRVYHGRSDVARGYQRLLVRQHLEFQHPEADRPLSAHRRLREAQRDAEDVDERRQEDEAELVAGDVDERQEDEAELVGPGAGGDDTQEGAAEGQL